MTLIGHLRVRKSRFRQRNGILTYVAITKTDDGKFHSRLQLPTSRRDENGRIIRKEVTKTFPTRGAADAWERLQKTQQARTGLDATLTVGEAVEYREAKDLARGIDLRKVAADWARRHPEKAEATVDEVLTSFVNSKYWNRYAPTTQDREISVINRFRARFGQEFIRRITTEEVEDYLDEIPATVTRNNHLRILRVLLKWAMDRRHRYLSNSPLEAITEEPEDDEAPPAFFSLEQTRKLFETAAKADTALIPLLALGHFAGVRSFEIERLRPHHFLFDDRTINISGEVAKRKRKGKPLPRRIEGLPDTLWEWLQVVGFRGVLDLQNYKVRRRRLYEQAGIYGFHSAARHTFATHAYAYTKDCGRCRTWTGHRGGDTIFLNHYAALESEARGREYFQILPAGPLEIRRSKSKFDNRAHWPADKELLTWVERESKVAVAKSLGVSEAAVRKRLQRISDKTPEL